MSSQDGSGSELTAPSHLEDQIFIIRGRRVMLDSDLAAIYGVLPKRLNEQVKRNKARFPPDFLFRLTPDEVDALRPHSATSKPGRGGRRYQPYAFTEHGAVMLASVLNSPAAVAASIHVVRAFVRLCEIVGIHKEPTAKLDALEAKYDSQFRVVFEAIRELMRPPATTRVSRIGFRASQTERDPTSDR